MPHEDRVRPVPCLSASIFKPGDEIIVQSARRPDRSPAASVGSMARSSGRLVDAEDGAEDESPTRLARLRKLRRPTEEADGAMVARTFPNSTIVCIASGPSLTREDVDACRGAAGVVLAVNDTITYAPWADVLYACDRRWWQEHPRRRPPSPA
jgi:hypothetical protein